jgi:hypothetical protein
MLDESWVPEPPIGSPREGMRAVGNSSVRAGSALDPSRIRLSSGRHEAKPGC